MWDCLTNVAFSNFPEVPKISSCLIQSKSSVSVDVKCALVKKTAQFEIDYYVAVSQSNFETIRHFKTPEFRVDQLRANTSYVISVTANNTHGTSSRYTFKVTTKAQLKPYLNLKNWISFSSDETASGHPQNPIKLLPVVAGLAGAILFLILISILIVVIIRNRQIKENISVGKTHISFSADIDREVENEDYPDQGN